MSAASALGVPAARNRPKSPSDPEMFPTIFLTLLFKKPLLTRTGLLKTAKTQEPCSWVFASN
jgi:hypothetical protein